MPKQIKKETKAPKGPKEKETPAPKGPSESQLMAAFKLWLGGGVSLWDIKKKTKIKAKDQLPFFRAHASAADRKVLKSPGSRKPVADKEGRARRVA
jgi:hypothetical protein